MQTSKSLGLADLSFGCTTVAAICPTCCDTVTNKLQTMAPAACSSTCVWVMCTYHICSHLGPRTASWLLSQGRGVQGHGVKGTWGPQGHESTEMQGPCSVCSLACGQHPSVPDSDQYWAKRQDGAMCAMHPDARQQLHLIDPHAQGSSMTNICSSSEAAGAYNAVMDGDGSSNSRMAAEAGRSVAMAADRWQHQEKNGSKKHCSRPQDDVCVP